MTLVITEQILNVPFKKNGKKSSRPLFSNWFIGDVAENCLAKLKAGKLGYTESK